MATAVLNGESDETMSKHDIETFKEESDTNISSMMSINSAFADIFARNEMMVNSAFADIFARNEMMINSAFENIVQPHEIITSAFSLLSTQNLIASGLVDVLSTRQILDATFANMPSIEELTNIADKLAIYEESIFVIHTAYKQVKDGIKDYAYFKEIVEAVDWPSQSSSVLKKTIDMVLSFDDIELARRLSKIGVHTYPSNEYIKKIAKAIAPPRIVKTDLPSKPSLRGTMEWLQRHGNDYRGKWVAIQNGTFLGANDNRKLLIDEIGNNIQEDTLVTRIPE